MNYTVKINNHNKILEEKIDKKDIIWNEVIMQIGDDKDFLIEILNDFKNELDIAENEIQLGINLHDLLIIKKTAQNSELVSRAKSRKENFPGFYFFK